MKEFTKANLGRKEYLASSASERASNIDASALSSHWSVCLDHIGATLSCKKTTKQGAFKQGICIGNMGALLSGDQM